MLLSKFSSTFFNLVYRLIYYLDVIIRFDLLMCVLNVLNKAHIVGAFGVTFLCYLSLYVSKTY